MVGPIDKDVGLGWSCRLERHGWSNNWRRTSRQFDRMTYARLQVVELRNYQIC